MRCRVFSLLAVAAILVAIGCRVTDLPIWNPIEPIAADHFAVTVERDIVYRDGEGADKMRNSLDLYLPKGAKDYPVLVLVHGGAWVIGDNRCCGLYPSIADFLARRGIGVVMPNYRLSPWVKHPEHVKDVARAIAWTKSHLGAMGGRTDKLFLAGHSAGGHLVALVTTDPTYLRAEKLSEKDIAGVVGISGVYRIPDGKFAVAFGGDSGKSFRFDEISPMRSKRDLGKPTEGAGIPLTVDVFSPAFGDSAIARQAASPVVHARPGLPPFLLINADHDLPTLADMSKEFAAVLTEHGVDARLMTAENRNHNTVMFRAIEESDPVARALLDFIRPTVR
jgi:acetyl esterase/lipase